MNMNKMMMTVAVAITVGNVLAKTNLAEVIEIVDGEMKWRFVPVAGTSQLPLKFMRTGKDRDKTDPVTMPKFWIAEKNMNTTLRTGADLSSGRRPSPRNEGSKRGILRTDGPSKC